MWSNLPIVRSRPKAMGYGRQLGFVVTLPVKSIGLASIWLSQTRPLDVYWAFAVRVEEELLNGTPLG